MIEKLNTVFAILYSIQPKSACHYFLISTASFSLKAEVICPFTLPS